MKAEQIVQISEEVRKHVMVHREAYHRRLFGEVVLNAFKNVDIFILVGLKTVVPYSTIDLT